MFGVKPPRFWKLRSTIGRGRTFTEWDINNQSNETWNSIMVSFAGKSVTWHLTKTRSGKKPTKKTDLKEIDWIVEQVQSTVKDAYGKDSNFILEILDGFSSSTK